MEWKTSEQTGTRERIHEVYDMQHVKLYRCVNNIVVGVLQQKKSKYKFLRTKTAQKLKTNAKLMIVNDNAVCLPFKCKVIEIVEQENYKEYCFIVQMTE